MRSWLPHRYQQVTRSDLTCGECTCGTHSLRGEGSFAAAQAMLRGELCRGQRTTLRSPTSYRLNLTRLSLSEYRMVKLLES